MSRKCLRCEMMIMRDYLRPLPCYKMLVAARFSADSHYYLLTSHDNFWHQPAQLFLSHYYHTDAKIGNTSPVCHEVLTNYHLLHQDTMLNCHSKNGLLLLLFFLIIHLFFNVILRSEWFETDHFLVKIIFLCFTVLRFVFAPDSAPDLGLGSFGHKSSHFLSNTVSKCSCELLLIGSVSPTSSILFRTWSNISCPRRSLTWSKTMFLSP